jgi:hypothetical protein
MAGPCPADFARLAATVGGFTCQEGRPFIQLRDPFRLTNWTLPVLEALIVTCAVLALVHAIRRHRRHADPTALAIWLATVVYLAVIEPPVYFPNLAGQKTVVFAHNVFTVEFLWDRLPLYIVAIYPAVTVLAYEIVRALGTFTARGVLAGSVAVMFVHQCLYEVFDQLGPQRSWWIWNPQAAANHPSIASVPLNSILLFATLGPGIITFTVLTIAKRHGGAGLSSPGRLAGGIAAAGVAAPIGVVLGGIPGRIAGGSGKPDVGAQAVVLVTLTAIPLAIGAYTLAAAWRGRNARPARGLPVIMWASGALFATVLAALWASSLPEYFSAIDGITSAGTRTGSLPYAAACLALCGLLLAAVRPRRGASASPDQSQPATRPRNSDHLTPPEARSPGRPGEGVPSGTRGH